jgi:hypothetical protein
MLSGVGVLLGTARGTKWLPYPTQVWLALNLIALAAGLLTPLYTLLSAPIAAVGYFAEMIIHSLGAASVLCAIVSGMVCCIYCVDLHNRMPNNIKYGLH